MRIGVWFIVIMCICLMTFALEESCQAQPWAGIIAPSRAADWTSNTGLPSVILYGTGGAACDGAHANCMEATLNPWTIPPRVQCGSTLPAGSTPAAISTAIAACLPGSYVKLASGSFTINASVTMRTNGVSLRGSGGSSSILNTSAGALFQFGVCCGGSYGPISGTPIAGANSFTLTGATGTPLINQIADINQCDQGWSGTGLVSGSAEVSCTSGGYSDPGTFWACGKDYVTCSNNNTPNGNHNFQHQMVNITNVIGSCPSSCVVTFSPPLYMPNWGSTSNASLIWQSVSNQSIGIGLEDLTLAFTYTGTEQVRTQSSYAWWVKGVRFIGDGQTSRMNIGDHSVQGLFANNYMFGENSNNLFTASSEPLLRALDTGTLIINNIISGSLCLWGNGGMAGEGVAYNDCLDSQTPDNQALMLNHNPLESMGLLEGNMAAQIHSDDTHGTNGLMTYFRNYSSGYDAPYITTHARSYFNGDYNRFNNYIGNAIGGILTTGYQSTGGNDNGVEYVFQNDALTQAGLMRWGNCDTVTGTCRFQASEVPNATNMSTASWPNATPFQNPTPANNNLPCSLLISGPAFSASPCVPKLSGGTGLSWWKVCVNWASFPTACSSSQIPPFPIAGPDITGGPYVFGHAYDNPAAVAHQYLPIDTARQNHLTITGSAWSNSPSTCQIVGGAGGILTGVAPCEIFTVSFASIDNGSAEHIMGGFQLSGVAAGCIPAGINFSNLYGANEIRMTGSTTGTVAYALPSSSPDNGSSNQCLGTLLFPDIRLFDERVYQNDSAAGSVLGSPAGLNLAVN